MNKSFLKATRQNQNQYLDFLKDQSFQGVNRLFKVPFEMKNGRKLQTRFYLPKVDIKDGSIMIDRKIFFVRPKKLRQ